MVEPSAVPDKGDEVTTLIRLRYRGTCEVCGVALPARSEGWYDPARKKVRCLTCAYESGAPKSTPGSEPVDEGPAAPVRTVEAGEAGSSARRVYERRSGRFRVQAETKVTRDAEWRKQVKQDHPFLGRIAAAATPKPVIGPEPRHVTAWQTGSHGEVRVGGLLDQWATETGGLVLHDRRVPRSRANIDHLVVAPSGVWVIDAKEYKGALEKVDVGGLFRTDFRLRVGGRDRSKLADGVEWQVGIVSQALAPILPGASVHGVLCFVGAEWPLLFRKPLQFRTVTVIWPAALGDLLRRPGSWQHEQLPTVAAALGNVFRPA